MNFHPLPPFTRRSDDNNWQEKLMRGRRWTKLRKQSCKYFRSQTSNNSNKPRLSGRVSQGLWVECIRGWAGFGSAKKGCGMNGNGGTEEKRRETGQPNNMSLYFRYNTSGGCYLSRPLSSFSSSWPPYTNYPVDVAVVAVVLIISWWHRRMGSSVEFSITWMDSSKRSDIDGSVCWSDRIHPQWLGRDAGYPRWLTLAVTGWLTGCSFVAGVAAAPARGPIPRITWPYRVTRSG